jgi:hypothetical protein
LGRGEEDLEKRRVPEQREEKVLGWGEGLGGKECRNREQEEFRSRESNKSAGTERGRRVQEQRERLE